MINDRYLPEIVVRIAGIFNVATTILRGYPFVVPKKILILKPCHLSEIMPATALLTALSDAYPHAQIDWAISDAMRPVVATNKRLCHLISTGRVAMPDQTRQDIDDLIALVKAEKYDTCFVPDGAAVLAYVAWNAGIFQRIGLNVRGAGLTHTIRLPATQNYLHLAEACGITATPAMTFALPDTDRTTITQRLVEQTDWRGDTPLIVLHPTEDHGNNPWQLERFVRLGNYLVRELGATLILAGLDHDQSQANKIAGLMSTPVLNWVGGLTIGEWGALWEVADLSVGVHLGGSQVAVAVGCKTILITGQAHQAKAFSTTNPNQAHVLFAEDTVSVESVIKIVNKQLTVNHPS